MKIPNFLFCFSSYFFLFDFLKIGDASLVQGIKSIPFQIQISYTKMDGTKCLRVISKAEMITKDRQAAEQNINGLFLFSVFLHFKFFLFLETFSFLFCCFFFFSFFCVRVSSKAEMITKGRQPAEQNINGLFFFFFPKEIFYFFFLFCSVLFSLSRDLFLFFSLSFFGFFLVRFFCFLFPFFSGKFFF